MTGNAADSDVLKGKTYYSTDAKAKRTGALVLTGDAADGHVLSGKTYYNTDAKTRRTGSMPNRGNLNWSGNNTTYNVPAGYYGGGVLDSRPSYNLGHTNGYNTGYANGQVNFVTKKGTFYLERDTWNKVTGLPFTPRIIIVQRASDVTSEVSSSDIQIISGGFQVYGRNGFRPNAVYFAIK